MTEIDDPISQQTEQTPVPPDDHWIAQVPTKDGWDFIVFGGRTYDATYKTMAEAQARIDYIRAGGDGW